MIVALPFSHKDGALAEKLLGWINELSPDLRPHRLVLLGSTLSDKAQQARMEAQARGIFGHVSSIRQVQAEERGWPLAPNALFRVMTKYIATVYSKPFLWMEPDCVPLKPDWLDRIEEEYQTCGKRHMGHVWNLPRPHCNGNSVYPAGFVYSTTNPQAFDVLLGTQVLQSCHQTELIHHIWNLDERNRPGYKGRPPTFPDLKSIKLIPRRAVLFHRCKDASLIDRLREAEEINSRGTLARLVQAIRSQVKAASPPRFWHAFEAHEPLSPRETRAQSTWSVLQQELNWQPVPLREPYPRSSRDIGDPRGTPYINDVLANALTPASPMDVIVFTNGDIALLPEVHTDILRALERFPAVCSSRRDVKDFSAVLRAPPTNRHIHYGRDLFAFRAWWLKKMLPKIPPLLLGSQEWDNLLLMLLRKEAGVVIRGPWNETPARLISWCEMASPNVLHEEHPAYAFAEANLNHPGNVWNRVQFLNWAKVNCPELSFDYLEPLQAKCEAGEIQFEACHV